MAARKEGTETKNKTQDNTHTHTHTNTKVRRRNGVFITKRGLPPKRQEKQQRKQKKKTETKRHERKLTQLTKLNEGRHLAAPTGCTVAVHGRRRRANAENKNE